MTIRNRALSVLCVLAAMTAAGALGAAAQGWGWEDERGRSSEQQPGYGRSAEPTEYARRPAYGEDDRPARSFSSPAVSARCRELEYQLTGGSPSSSDQLPRIEADLRQADDQYRRLQADLDHANCYEDMFLLGRSLRRTQRCIELDRQVQSAKSTLGQLRAQREAAMKGSSQRGRHSDLIAELARNRCGDQYVREYESQRSSRSGSIFSFFSDEDRDDEPNRWSATTGATEYGSSTYRTLCVRECDGFYFPLSTTATESQFRDDDAKCRSQCAAPAELFYHRSNQDVEQMFSLSGRPYSEMPNAFRYRKVYIRGCSCNEREYSREEIAKSEEALKTAKRADASSSKAPPDAAFARRISQAVQNAPSASPPANAPAPADTPAPPPADPEH
ncbi:MAG: DUF2865 domain-containing protein [Rhodomicrobium sp.]